MEKWRPTLDHHLFNKLQISNIVAIASYNSDTPYVEHLPSSNQRFDRKTIAAVNSK